MCILREMCSLDTHISRATVALLVMLMCVCVCELVPCGFLLLQSH